MPKTTALFLISILFLINGYAQKEIKELVLQNAVSLSEENASEGFQKIGEAIGEAKIVFIGEQDHGDGSTFLIKADLIKYLHKHKGFNVIAFESDIYSVNYAWTEYKAGNISTDSAIKSSIYQVWTNCTQTSKTFEYIAQTQKNPNHISLTGFDNQLFFKIGLKNLAGDLITYLSTKPIEFSKTSYYQQYFSTDLDSLMKIFRYNNDNKAAKLVMLKKMKDILSGIQGQLISANLNADYHFLIIENCIAYCEQLIFTYEGNEYNSSAVRDKQMADNLTWLATHLFKDEKIIVWAANSHIMNNSSSGLKKVFNKPPSMGSFIKFDPILGPQSFLLGFTGYTGEFGRATVNKTYKIQRPKLNSIETWLHEANYKKSFVNFRPLQTNKESFFMNCFNWRDYKAAWQNFFDGIIYLENTEPCTKVFRFK